MAENEEIKEGTPAPAQDDGTNPSPAVDETADLKAFMGEAYKDGLTLAEVSAFLKGKKYADLNTGNYVSKKKYDDLEKKHADYLESTKDYENLKTENTAFKEKERMSTLTKQAEAAGIDSQFIEFALSRIDPNAEDTEKALKEWVKKNPQFQVERRVIDTSPRHEGKGNPARSMSDTINANLRAAAGKQQ